MAKWNYRLLQLDDCIGIVEAYYDEEGNVVAYSEPLMVIDEVDELPELLVRIALAAKKGMIYERDEGVSDSVI